MKIGIITAMSSEQKQLANQLRDKTECTKGPFNYIEGTIKNNTIILMQCGIGKVNAAAGAVELIRNFEQVPIFGQVHSYQKVSLPQAG